MDNRGTKIFVMDVIAIVIFAIYCIALSADLFAIAQNLPLYLIALSAIIGYILADFLSGFVHFLGDTFGSETTPIIGAAFVQPFRKHHTDPEDITKHGFVETNGHNCLVSIPVMIIMAHVLVKYAVVSVAAGFAFATSYFLILGVFLTNQFHKWAHMKHTPAPIRFLQRSRLILSPAHHKIHHTSPYTRYFCITTGWLNFTLDRLLFFPIAKFTIRRIPFMLKTAEEYTKTP
ncbi:MAG: fatty acid desaturase CarF family protein [Patescibacteria group bacterium]